MTLLAVALVLAQNPVVTFRSAAQPLERTLAALSQTAGVKLEAEGRVGDEVVVVAVKDAPLDEVRQRLAQAVAGEWVQDGGRWLIRRDVALAKRQEQEELQRQADRYAKRIQEMVRQVVETPTLTAEEADRRMKRLAQLNEEIRQGQEGRQVVSGISVEPGGSPQDRLLTRILQVIDPRDLASVPADTRFVYSSHPNPMQRALPAAARRAVSAFANEYAVWQSAAARYRPTDPERIVIDFGDFGPLPSAPAEVFLIVSRWGDAPGLSCDAKVVDAKGNVLATASTGLDAAKDTPGKEEAPPKPAAGEKPIAFSRDSLEILKLRTSMGTGAESPVPSRELHSKLLAPEQFDPLGFAASDVTLGIGEGSGKQFVASLPDSLADAFWTAGTMTPSGARMALESMEAMAFASDDRWLVGTPAWPAASRSRRLPRNLLGDLLRQLDRSGASSLDALAKFALREGGTGLPSLAQGALALLQPQVAAGQDSSTYELLKVYGSLSPTQRAAIGRPGGELSISDLSVDGRKALTKVLFYGTGGMQVMRLDEAVPTDPQVQTFAETMAVEPTEAMPSGLPARARLQFEFDTRDVALAYGGASFSADDLGAQLAMRERPEVFTFVGEAPLPPRFTMATRTIVMGTLTLPSNALATFSLQDFRTGDGKFLTMAQLPPAFLALVDKARKDARESFKNIPLPGAGGGGSNIPPVLR